MLLKKLIKKLPREKKETYIRGLTTNSKKVEKGFIFFAIKGNKSNGEKFINEAIKNGASVIVCSKKPKSYNKDITIIKTSDVRYYLSKISSKFYKLKPKNIFAVTGTNGKTSVADLFYQILMINKVPVASIGTLGIKHKGKVIKSNLTSPDTISIHKKLEEIKKDKVENVIIEASSHGLHQKRLEFLNFKAGIFTNFSQDHLDYHKTMRSYLNAKLVLFKYLLKKKRSIITDKTIREYSILNKISKKKKLKLIDIGQIKEKLNTFNFLRLNNFQLKNLAMAIAAAKLCKLKEKKIFNSLPKIKGINGRLELVKTFQNNIKIYVDFAHTPDALKKSIEALKEADNKNISLVFGCGGDRDFYKRLLMAKIADENCKTVYVTDDNPRNEKPEKIRKDIIKGIKKVKFFNIGNRVKAIKSAILNADPNEIILVAGKGHEEEQIYKDKIIQISDKKIIKNLKLKIKKFSLGEQNFIQNKKILSEITRKTYIRNFHGISIDSRILKKNNLFLTIKGKKNNGINFIPKALKKGASYIITSKPIKKYIKKTIKVKNEKKFLNKLATMKRDNNNAKICAITGSAGKTTLKNLINDLLKNFGKTYCSPRSYNNHFGVPISLTQLKTEHNYGVFEVGMNKKGEINTLSKIIKPDIAIITNIGEAHIENFKNLKGIADAKSEIIQNIKKSGTIILNRDDKYFHYLNKKAKNRKLKVVCFGKNKKSDARLLKKSSNNKENYLTVKIKDQILSLKTKNINIYNLLSSLALLRELNLDLKKISKYFLNYEPVEGRGKIHNIKRYKKNFKLIDESYNANPLSVKNAIENFNLINKQKNKKYLLLGDMLELGKKSNFLHKDLSKVINNSDIDKVFIKGVKTLVTFRNIDKKKRGNIFQQDEDVDFTLNNIIANNDYLMIKGSNATGLNNLSKRIIKGY